MLVSPTEIWIGFGIWAVIFTLFSINLVRDDVDQRRQIKKSK
jgi:hypothetical protein